MAVFGYKKILLREKKRYEPSLSLLSANVCTSCGGSFSAPTTVTWETLSAGRYETQCTAYTAAAMRSSARKTTPARARLRRARNGKRFCSRGDGAPAGNERTRPGFWRKSTIRFDDIFPHVCPEYLRDFNVAICSLIVFDYLTEDARHRKRRVVE